MCQPCAVSGKHSLPRVIHLLWLLQSFHFLFCMDPWAFRRQSNKDIHLEQSCILRTLFRDLCASYHLLQEATSQMRIGALIGGYSNMTLGVMLLRSFSQIIVVGLPQEPMTYLVTSGIHVSLHNILLSEACSLLHILQKKKKSDNSLSTKSNIYMLIVNTDTCNTGMNAFHMFPGRIWLYQNQRVLSTHVDFA